MTASRSSASRESWSTLRESRSTENIALPVRVRLASYMAASARLSSTSWVLPCSGARAAPTLAPTARETPASWTGARISSRSRSATSPALPRSAPSTTAANSSPPRRATSTWSDRNPRRIRSPTTCSRVSPTLWPSVSLTFLNPSRSSSITVSGSPATSRVRSSSRKCLRFGRPVSSSVRASAWARISRRVSTTESISRRVATSTAPRLNIATTTGSVRTAPLNRMAVLAALSTVGATMPARVCTSSRVEADLAQAAGASPAKASDQPASSTPPSR